MLIEKENDNQITIKVSASVDALGLQRLIDYTKCFETTSKSRAKQSDVDKLAGELNQIYWSNRKPHVRGNKNQ